MRDTQLVINADDLGFSAEMNATIQEGHRKGVITNASLMVDGQDVPGALEVIRECPDLGIGLHLELDAVFGFRTTPYAEMRDNLRTPEMQDKVSDEMERQIRRFKGFGLEFTHLDGHRHFHALPEIFPRVVEVGAAHGLKSIRMTKDWILPRTPSVYWSDEFLAAAIELLDRHGILYPRTFIYGADEYSASWFKPGVNELMVHVSYQDPWFFKEYSRVCDPGLWREMEEMRVEVLSYRDLVQAAAR